MAINVSDYTIKTKYLEYISSDFFKKSIERDFSNEVFEELYKNHPGRMTPEQIKAHGYDIARSRLWSNFLDNKYKSLYTNELMVSKMVIDQISKVIKEMFPDLDVKRNEGWVKNYGDKLCFDSLIVGVNDNYNVAYFKIVPTTDHAEGNDFCLDYNTPYLDKSVKCSDEELIGELEKLNDFIKNGIVPTTFIQKVVHRYENQYILNVNDMCLGLYDVEFVMLYNCIAKESNKLFGTDYPYSQKMIDALYKVNTFGSNKYLGSFYLHKSSGDNMRLEESYYYLDDNKKPNFKCYATYGFWNKNKIISLLDTLKPYVINNYFERTSKEALKKKYDQYDKIGIGYTERPDYFDILHWVC